jgi:HEAT repeat protein
MRPGALALLVALAPGAALAQPGRPPPLIPVERPAPFLPSTSGDLTGRFGSRVSERLLASPDPDERLRGVRRLAASDAPRDLDALIRSQEPGSLVARDLRARIEAVRSLGPHLAQDAARQVVVRALVDGATLASGDDAELSALLRDTAAMVLGRHGGHRGADALAGLLRQGGSVAAATARALVAHPPERLEALLGGRPPGSVELIELLQALGDLRAIPLLRQALRGNDPQVRAASLTALAALGDGEAPLVARHWVNENDPVARFAAVRALLRTSPAEGRAALVPLLREPDTRIEALRIAREGPGPELSGGLAALARDASLPGHLRALAVEALGRAGGEVAASALAGLLSSPDAHEAALALALSPGAPARKALERALRDGALRLVALRASVIRALALRDAPSGLGDALDAAWKGTPDERAAVAFARVALGKRSVDDEELRAPELSAAVARGALAAGPEALGKLLGLLERSPDAPRAHREALALGLLARPDGGRLSSRTLLAWVEEGGACAPLAARALAARDDEATRGSVERLLRSGSPQLRSHAALGLGRSPNADAAGRLADAYTFETEPSVRRAILRALSWRREPQRNAPLRLAALDPDATARSIARGALRGQHAPEQASGDLVAWLRVEGVTEPTALRWERPDGLVLPAVTDPDGTLLVPGLPASPSHATLPPSP